VEKVDKFLANEAKGKINVSPKQFGTQPSHSYVDISNFYTLNSLTNSFLIDQKRTVNF